MIAVWAADKDARVIHTQCSQLSYREHCYANALYKQTAHTTLSHARKTLVYLQELDPQNALGCHFLAHRIAQAEVEKNPAGWQEVAKALTPYECTGGYIHGVIETHVASDPQFELTTDAMHAICGAVAWDEGFSHRSCYHIMGHLLLTETLGNLTQALARCHPLTQNASVYECLSGTFMENLTRENLTAHGIAQKLIWNEQAASEIEQLCSSHHGIEAKACWKELSYIYITISGADATSLYTLCKRAQDPNAITDCFIYGAGNMVNFRQFDKTRLPFVCTVLPAGSREEKRCLQQLVGSLLTSSPKNMQWATTLCQSSSNKTLCFAAIQDVVRRNQF